MRQGPIKVVWIYSPKDKRFADEFLKTSALLEQMGDIQNWTPEHILPGQNWRKVLELNLQGADVIMLLISADLFAEDLWEKALELSKVNPFTRLVPVLLRSSLLPDSLMHLQRLPLDGSPIAAKKDRDASVLEVVQALREIAAFRADAKLTHLRKSSTSHPEKGPVRSEYGLDLAIEDDIDTRDDGRHAGHMGLEGDFEEDIHINLIFRLDGPPNFNFVEPSVFPAILLELRTLGTGLIMEGPSKVGKTTALKKAFERLNIPESQRVWWHGQTPGPFDEFNAYLQMLVDRKERTYLIIDDFHYLEDERYRRSLAFAMKKLADQDKRYVKVILIGINPLSSSLVQVMPDLVGRFRVFNLAPGNDPGSRERVREMIQLGERAANIRFTRRDEFVLEAGGSFYIAQLLCNSAAQLAGIYEPPNRTLDISFGPKDVERNLGRELAARFREPLIEFAAFDKYPPPRGAGLSLLWLLSQSADYTITAQEARLRFLTLGEVFDWFLTHVSTLLHQKASVGKLLFYHSATRTFSMEDPQLRFYLKVIDWQEFARASGHGFISFHHSDGPLWPLPKGDRISSGEKEHRPKTPSANSVGPSKSILHLSDLHFSLDDDATVSFSLLLDDLRSQEVDKLDALIISGDVVQFGDPKEYDAARFFLNKLMDRFDVPPEHVVLVPGNHDVNWQHAKNAYAPKRMEELFPKPKPGTFFEKSGEEIELRDDSLYRERFSAFSEFYRQIKGEEYPLDPEQQALIYGLDHLDALVLGLNSAWETDHHFRDRASIHQRALSNALLQMDGQPDRRLQIAVMHHPVSGDEDARIKDQGFLERLAQHGFNLILHGHIHRNTIEIYHYDHAVDGRKIRFLSAGTFGAPVREWVPGYPLQYNLLLLQPDRLTVELRCKRTLSGPWEPDARWRQGPGKDPAPRIHLDL